MNGIVDFHSHILPGMDDGSADVETSVGMLRLAAEQGISHMLATPHFYPRYDSPKEFLKKRAAAEKVLREAIQWEAGLPEISVGAEVYFFPGISDSDLVCELTFAEKRCILIEMPPSPWKDSYYRELEGVYVKHGITPVIAHVDRYIRPFKTHRIPERLAELPVLVQANASFFLQKSTARLALKLLREEKIQLLGSDCHNLTSRDPNLGQAVQLIRERLGAETLEQIREYERDVLAGVLV